MALEIVTNNVPREVITGFELTDEERSEFDYISQDDLPGREFVRYKGQVYDLDEFTRCTLNGFDQDAWNKWDGYFSDSAFSGILVRYCYGDYIGCVVMGTYYA